MHHNGSHMRVMIDTNILISSLIFNSPTIVMTLGIAASADNTLLISTFALAEARAVVHEKWLQRTDSLERFLAQLDYETITTPSQLQDGLFTIWDPNDYPVLYSAIIGRADIFITGDKDFEDVQVETISILTPAAFVSKFGSSKR